MPYYRVQLRLLQCAGFILPGDHHQWCVCAEWFVMADVLVFSEQEANRMATTFMSVYGDCARTAEIYIYDLIQ